MWRRTYLTLLLIRLYFALSSSYIHPDENFQGPELIVGEVFGYPTQLTWEFTSAEPIRSIFPLWLVYGLPMLLLRWILTGNDKSEEVSPAFVFWTLRVLMFTLSFVMEDWALYELIQSPRHRKVVVVLVASSYVTWTYQTHTFSNSIETLTVAWALVLIQRIVEKRVCNSYTICTSKLSLPQRRSSTFNSVMLGFILALGLFNRVTFPAFLFIPGLQLLPYLFKRPIALSVAMFSLLITSLVAIYLDSSFYTKNEVTWSSILWHPTITPINNIRYNLSRTNLSQHGLHPRYQHILFNLPQLIGPAFILLFRPEKSLRFYSAISGIFLLSFFEHQEARFLLPAVPLLLSSISLPKNKLYLKIWSITWIFFNVIFGILMGVYHQGGVVPTQLYLSRLHEASHALWWKTYSPPIWLLDGKNKSLKTHDLMGIKGSEMLQKLTILATCNQRNNSSQYQETEGTYLISPLSATYLESIIDNQMSQGLHFREIWRYKKHLSLDDLDFGEDGFWPTIKRVVGKRGIIVWKVTKDCCENCE